METLDPNDSEVERPGLPAFFLTRGATRQLLGTPPLVMVCENGELGSAAMGTLSGYPMSKTATTAKTRKPCLVKRPRLASCLG